MPISPIEQAYLADQLKDASNGTRNTVGTVLNPFSGGAVSGAYNAVFGGGKQLSGAERQQNEWGDRARQISNTEGISPELRAIVNGSSGYAENMDPASLLKRYETVADARDSKYSEYNDAYNHLQQVFGGTDRSNQYAYDTYKSVFGKGPTAEEFAKILPVFGGAEGRQRGAAYVSELFDQYKQSPEYLQGQSGKYSGDIGRIFQELYGRNATDAESQHFGTQLAGGRDQYDLTNELKSGQEYQTGQDKTFRSGLASELEGYDTSFFNKTKDNVIADYARRGFTGGSSSLDFALTKLMGDIAEKRGSYLAGISSQQYGGNKDAARSDYETSRNRYFQDQDYTRNQNTADTNYFRDRSDSDRDYQRQMSDYYDQIGRQNQSRGVLHSGDWIGLGLQGANAAASFRKPTYNSYDYFNY